MIRRISALSCLLWFVGALHAAEPAPAGRVVSVTGTAVAQVEPDVVVWHVQVRRTDVELAMANGLCDEAVKRVLILTKELSIAVKAAKQKAAAMTELLGAKLGRVARISEPTEGGPFGGWSGVSNTAFQMPRQALPDQQQGTFAPGSIEIRVSIEVAFEIE